MAELLYLRAREFGYVAKWYREELDDHPVHPKALKAQRRDGNNFTEACLRSWAEFVDKHRKEDVVHILEGSAFQSTVRFMMEERLGAIESYFRRFEEIESPSNPKMVYLRSQAPLQHSHYVSQLRGNAWTKKVSGNLEKTRYSTNEGLAGLNGMHRFWADYAALCDGLAGSARNPIKIIELVPGDWERHMSEASGFLGLNDSRSGL